jgi:hypothetical protein
VLVLFDGADVEAAQSDHIAGELCRDVIRLGSSDLETAITLLGNSKGLLRFLGIPGGVSCSDNYSSERSPQLMDFTTAEIQQCVCFVQGRSQ